MEGLKESELGIMVIKYGFGGSIRRKEYLLSVFSNTVWVFGMPSL